ncbi:MAG: hypothetical protein ACOYN3_01990 [Acidimicrobiia bacterium]
MTRNPALSALLEYNGVHLDQADALLEDGRPKEALALYSVAFYEGIERAHVAARAARCCLELRLPYEAMAWAMWLEREDRELGRMLRAVAASQLQDARRVATFAKGCDPAVLERVGYGWEMGAIISAAGLLAANRARAAVTALTSALAASPENADLWAYLALAIAADKVVPDAVVELALRNPVNVMAWIQQGDPMGADAILEAVWAREPGSRLVLAVASSVAIRLPLDRAVTWSSRLRIAGLTERCPLRQMALDASRIPFDRLQAAVVVSSAFDDADARELLVAACASLPAASVCDGLMVVAELSMDLLDDALQAVANAFDTSLAGAAFLYAGGALDGAAVLVAQAFSCADADPMWGPQRTMTAVREYLDEVTATEIADYLSRSGEAMLADRVRQAF